MTSETARKTAHELFVDGLSRLAAAANSTDRHGSGTARAHLARLRRGFAGDRYVSDALAVVYTYDPPPGEEELWLLVGALFATHPRHRRGVGNLGASYGQLLRAHGGRAGAAERRFMQLIAVDGDALRHYLRQAVQLLASFEVPLDYYRLLLDLRVLLSDGSSIKDAEIRQRVRLAWLKDFHRTQTSSSAEPRRAQNAPGELVETTEDAATNDVLDA